MKKIKYFIGSEKGKDVLIVIIVILVGLGSFELGRLSKENDSSGLKIEYPTQDQLKEIDQAKKVDSVTEPIKAATTVKNFFASSRGSRYYPAGCSAGKNIIQENRVYFATREEAETAGYTLSSSCN